MSYVLKRARMSFRIPALILGIAFAATQFSAAPVNAASDAPEPASPVQKCKKKGYVWSSTLKKCVKKTSEILTDEDLYAQAWADAQSGEHQAALDILWRIKNQKQPKVLNYIGFNLRKLGRIEEGIGYYKKALALDSGYVKARQYLGEGYLQLKDLTKARNELKEIKARCGVACDEYHQLAKAISDYRTQIN